MKKNLTLLLMATVVLLLPSCYATRTRVGGYREEIKEEKASTYTYAKGKQAYMFWGLLPLGRTSVATPNDGVCEIKTRHGFLDAVVSLITGGIFSMQTIKVKATKNNPSTTQAYLPATPAQQYNAPATPQPASDPELDTVRQLLQ